MNGPSGFQEVWSSTSRSPAYRFLHEQRSQFGTGAWHLLRTRLVQGCALPAPPQDFPSVNTTGSAIAAFSRKRTGRNHDPITSCCMSQQEERMKQHTGNSRFFFLRPRILRHRQHDGSDHCEGQRVIEAAPRNTTLLELSLSLDMAGLEIRKNVEHYACDGRLSRCASMDCQMVCWKDLNLMSVS